ncbi:MAG TPA: hypothetical protein VK915_02610 [Gaiellaceae bacterium]|nr:hypothetical protein [Gaiellaceae bacterium]
MSSNELPDVLTDDADDGRDLVSLTDPDGDETETAYDERELPVTWRDSHGGVVFPGQHRVQGKTMVGLLHGGRVPAVRPRDAVRRRARAAALRADWTAPHVSPAAARLPFVRRPASPGA